MYTGQIRLISQLVLTGIILLAALATVPIMRHIEGVIPPTYADGNEWATIPEIPNPPEHSVEEYPFIIRQPTFGNTDLWKKATKLPSGQDAVSLMQWKDDEPSLALSDKFPGTPATFPGSIEDPAKDAPDVDILVALVSYIRTYVYTYIRMLTDGNDTTLAFAEQNAKNKSDTAKTTPPVKQAAIRVQTKIGYIETVLRKAIVEPYCINGQTKGLRITGLEKISLTRDLLLKSGDIIRAINGQMLNSKRQAYEIFKKARMQPTMTVDLLRDGETKILLFDFR